MLPHSSRSPLRLEFPSLPPSHSGNAPAASRLATIPRARAPSARAVRCVRRTPRWRKAPVCGWHRVTRRYGDIVTSGFRASRNKNRKNLPQVPSRPEGKPSGGENPKPSRILSRLDRPRYSTPAPVSTPQKPRVRAGWGDLGDSRGGKRDRGIQFTLHGQCVR